MTKDGLKRKTGKQYTMLMMVRDICEEELNDVTGFSLYRTDALKTYANTGMPKAAREVMKIIGGTDIPEAHQLPFAMQLANCVVNGEMGKAIRHEVPAEAKRRGDPIPWSIKDKVYYLVDNNLTGILQRHYDRTRPFTISRWSKAIAIVDKAKSKIVPKRTDEEWVRMYPGLHNAVRFYLTAKGKWESGKFQFVADNCNVRLLERANDEALAFEDDLEEFVSQYDYEYREEIDIYSPNMGAVLKML